MDTQNTDGATDETAMPAVPADGGDDAATADAPAAAPMGDAPAEGGDATPADGDAERPAEGEETEAAA